MALPVGLARYGLREILASLVICGGGAAALWVYATPWAAIGPGVLFLFTLYFFRDPRRVPPEGEGLIVSPADGTVVDIEEVDEPEFLGGRSERVGIFLSLFSVHINRAPLAGRVGYVKYKPGRFLAAFNERASAENESNIVGLETDLETRAGGKLKVAVKQISGVIARRIVCACREAQELGRGEKFGMIKFGSRTELYLPPGAAELTVSVGDKVRAGRTVIGRVVAGAGAEPAPRRDETG
ncbi:MAG: phosphatidylserine decarboxylase family protein [Planctomycetota bacterium]|jgi:phosphatidylserine decarboxylase